MTDQLKAEAEEVARRLRDDKIWVSHDLRIKAEDAAYELGIEPKTLRNWRYERKEPQPIDVCGQPTYFLVDILKQRKLPKAA